jgi:hypothetical protein
MAASRIRSWVPDLVVIVGILLVAYGAGLHYAPLGPIVLGLGLIVAVSLGSR